MVALNILGLLWMMSAYVCSAVMALRVFNLLRCEHAPRALCSIPEATSLLFLGKTQSKTVSEKDLIRAGSLTATAALLAMAGNSALYLADASWRNLGEFPSFLWILSHALLGSSLIVVFAGLESMIKQAKDAEC